jgi:hypothetical protein
MKKLLLCLAVVTLSGCNNLSKNLVVDNCPAKPEGILAGRRTSIILASNQPIELRDRAVNNEYIGYTFQARSGQKLSYNTADNICIWVYAPDNQILPTNVESLPITGEYQLQIAARQKSVSNFTLQVGLDVPQPSFKSSGNNFIQASTQVVASTVSPEKKALSERSKWLRDVVIIPAALNIFTSVLLGILGYSQLRSVKELIQDRRTYKEYGNLKKFFIPNFHNNPSSDQKYQIFYFGDDQEPENQQSQNLTIKHTLVLSIYKLIRFLEKISNEEIELKRLAPQRKLRSESFNNDHNVVILGLKSGLKDYFEDFYNKLEINPDFYNTKENSCSSLVLRLKNPYNPDKFIIVLDDISQGLGILGATKLITTPETEHSSERIFQNIHNHFINAVREQNNPNLKLYVKIQANTRERISPKVIEVRINEDVETKILVSPERIKEALDIICS